MDIDYVRKLLDKKLDKATWYRLWTSRGHKLDNLDVDKPPFSWIQPETCFSLVMKPATTYFLLFIFSNILLILDNSIYSLTRPSVRRT